MNTNNQNINRGGRPLKQSRRNKKITIRLSATEYFVVKQKADKAGMHLSGYLRESAFYANIKSRLSEEDRHFYRQLIGFANNLNQLAKLAHQQGLSSALRFFSSELNQINDLLNKLQK